MSTHMNLANAVNVVLPVDYAAISRTHRDGSDLIITLTDGQVLILDDFFAIQRSLMTNGTQGVAVQELSLSEEGNIIGFRQYTMEQVSNAFGGNSLELDLQTNEVVLLSEPYSPHSAYTFLGTSLVIVGSHWLAMRNDKSDNVFIKAEETNHPTVRYDYDSAGLPLKAYFDSNQDGTVESSVSYTRNDQGLITREQVDLNNNGSVESQIDYHYQAGKVGSLNISNRLDGYVEDLTQAHSGRLESWKGIHTIEFSDNVSNTLVLDGNRLADLLQTQGTLTILGDSSDTVSLKGFTQVASQQADYEQYQTTVDSRSYTLLIENELNVVLA